MTPPWKPGPAAHIRKMLPTGDSPFMIKTDLAHTYAIAGWGKEDLSSSLVFLAVRCAVFGPGVYQDQLDWAYESFESWCYEHKKTTTIKDFSKDELKITSLFACKNEQYLLILAVYLAHARFNHQLLCLGCNAFQEDWERALMLPMLVHGWRTFWHMWT